MANTPPEPDHARHDGDNLKGMVWMGVSVVGASIMTVAVRGAAAEVSSTMIVFYRSVLILLVVAAALAALPRARQALRFTSPGLHILRGCLIGFATQLGFYAIAEIPLATATVLFFTAPIIATVINVFLHGERVGPRRIAAIVAGFLGAVVVLRPDVGRVEIGMVSAMGSAMCFALALSLSRNLSRIDGAFSAYVSSVFFTLLVTLPLSVGNFEVPQLPWTWIALGAIVLASALRGYADILAYHLAEASVLAPLAYTRLVLVGLAAYVMFDEVPDTATLIGAAIIVGSTLYIAQRQAKAGGKYGDT